MQLSTIIGAKGGTVVTIQPDASVADLIAMLAEHNVGALVVSADGRTITGIVSERDVVHTLTHGGTPTPCRLDHDNACLLRSA
jgi:CBS domain-containing protein